MADHSIGSDIDGLLSKVNMNSAFLGLAKNDTELVNDMKAAIVQLWNAARRREVLYIAVEHNIKYLTAICQASDHAKDLALNEVASLKVNFAKQKVEFDEMQRQVKVLSKDSEQLTAERKRITQLTLDFTKAKEKEEQMSSQLTDAKKKLKKAEKSLTETKNEFEDKKRHLEHLSDEHAELKKQHSNVTDTSARATEDVKDLKQQNENYRSHIVKNETILTKQTAQLKDFKNKAETSKKDAERLKEENEVLLKQNATLVLDVQNGIQDPLKKLQADRANAAAIQDGKQLNASQLKDQLKEAKQQMITIKEENQARLEDLHQEIAVSREANSLLKENQEMEAA